jgi:hypothetical protein
LTALPAILARNIEDQDYQTFLTGRWMDRGTGIGLVCGLAAAFFLARRSPGTVAPGAGTLPEPAAEW